MTPEIQNNTPEQPDTTDTTPPTVVEEAPPEPVAAETPLPQPEPPQEPAQWQPEKHRFDSIGILVATVAGVLLALYAFRLPPFGLGEVYTNNAYVRGNITVVSPRVSGYVQNVLVRDFDTVKAGQPLVEIDRAPYLSKVEQAKAGILAQQAALDKTKQDRASAQSAAKAGQAAIANAQAVLDRANREWKRIKGVSNDAISQSSRDAAQIAVKQAEAALTQAKEQYAIAQQNILNAGVGREGAAIDNAKAMLALAEQELGHTTVYAPADGLLGEVAVKKGQLVSAGTQLMSVVPAARWIVANIKETDMKNIRSGQQADITVDALGGAHFSGSISEIAPATASEFSIIKADSGTGNFVKIAQRIVVKIELHPGQTDLHKLAPGMSVEVRIGTRQK
ncbi:MAG: HlyD family secretion protein [Cardiobacterium sp.]